MKWNEGVNGAKIKMMYRTTGRVVITEDGYLFAELQDGSFTDGNDVYDSESDMKKWFDVFEYDENSYGFDYDRYDDVIDAAENY
tara:strand:- start:298 stop:549 length:252 start_codon:yes stop_codon:yes gene_type:complete